MAEGYRSYVVRVRRREASPEAIRIDVEDLIGGRRSALTGDAARELADGLAAAVAEVAHPVPGLADPLVRPAEERAGAKADG